MIRELRTAAVALVAFTVITGLAYPMLILGVGHALFPRQASGALVEQRGLVVGSELVGQRFTEPGHFWSRPSAIETPYDATTSVGSNLAQGNPALHVLVAARVKKLRDADPAGTALVPIDLVTASASGLDPDISPAGALFQAARVARARGVAVDEVRALVVRHVEERTFGFLGEPRVNVVQLNLALDAMFEARR